MLKLKKLSTYLDALPEPFRGNALQSQQTNQLASTLTFVASPKTAVREAFHWASTLQGKTYWLNLTTQLILILS